MKKSIISTLIVFSVLINTSYSQDIISKLIHDNKGIENCHSVISDSNQDTYVTGVFHDNLLINDNLYKGNGSSDIFIIKYNKLNTIDWVKRLGGTYNDHVNEVVVDSKNNIYITGYFQGNFNIDADTLSNSFNSLSAFLIKLNSNGELVWSTSFNNNGIVGSSIGNSVAIDNDDNIILTGNYEGSITLNQNSLNFEPKGLKCGFVVKYNSNGKVIWKNEMNFSGFGTSNKVKTNKENDIYITGIYSNDLIIEDKTITSKGFTDVFLTKFTVDGKLEWLKNAGSNSHDYVNSLSIDKSGNAYICGNSESDIVFDNIILHNEAESDIYVAKYSAFGSVIWAKSAFGKGSETATAIIEKNENLVLIGNFNSDISWKNFQLKASKPSGFIAHYDSSGNLISAKKSNLSKMNSLSIEDKNEILIIVGQIYSSSNDRKSNDFEANFGLEKYSFKMQKIELLNEKNNSTALTLYPNPFSFKTTIKIEGAGTNTNHQLWVYDESGNIVVNGVTFTGNTYDLQMKESGLFLYRVLNFDNKLVGSGKFISN